MSGDEFFVLIVAGVAALVSVFMTTPAMLPELTLRKNAGAGLLRLSVLASLAWILFVLLRYSDPSVKSSGTYILFYLVIGYAVTKLLGQVGAGMFGPRVRVDVYERRNFPAALFVAAFTLGTAVIYGCSNWGEADPAGAGEGGWWIPLGFFLMGWLIFIGALGIYAARERSPLRRSIVQDRSLSDARAAASYLLGISVVISEGVAGDFFGWLHGILGLGLIAGMIVAHEVLASREDPTMTTVPEEIPTAGRIAESLFYLGLSGVFWLAQRWINAWLGVGGP